jgi:hypothetical protein
VKQLKASLLYFAIVLGILVGFGALALSIVAELLLAAGLQSQSIAQ